MNMGGKRAALGETGLGTAIGVKQFVGSRLAPRNGKAGAGIADRAGDVEQIARVRARAQRRCGGSTPDRGECQDAGAPCGSDTVSPPSSGVSKLRST